MQRTPRSSTPFKPPLKQKEVTPSAPAKSLSCEVSELEARVIDLDSQISALHSSGYRTSSLSEYVTRLHSYNETKDLCQALIGRLAHVKGVTSASLHQQFGLNPDD